MDIISHWDLKKKYFAANFYLIDKKPLSISDAQRTQLGTLHLYILFGSFTEDVELKFLSRCSAGERKKRVQQWKKLDCYSKSAAMNKFIDLIDNLFPNWRKSREIIAKFEYQWQKILNRDNFLESDGFKNPPTIFDHEIDNGQRFNEITSDSREVESKNKQTKNKPQEKLVELSQKRLNIEFIPSKPTDNYRLLKSKKRNNYFRRSSDFPEKLPALYKNLQSVSPRNLSTSLVIDKYYKSPTNMNLKKVRDIESTEKNQIQSTSTPKMSIFEDRVDKKFTVFSRLAVHLKDRYSLPHQYHFQDL